MSKIRNRQEAETIIDHALGVYEKGNREVAAFVGTIYVCCCGREKFEGPLRPVYEGSWDGFMEWKRENWKS